jgi:hypothetical protein
VSINEQSSREEGEQMVQEEVMKKLRVTMWLGNEVMIKVESDHVVQETR